MRHRHVPMHVLQQEIREIIAWQGFAIRHVISPGEPECSYTVGLHTSNWSRSERRWSRKKAMGSDMSVGKRILVL